MPRATAWHVSLLHAGVRARADEDGDGSTTTAAQETIMTMMMALTATLLGAAILTTTSTTWNLAVETLAMIAILATT
eukprot:7953352-Pyramimonas_sp.AAC.1